MLLESDNFYLFAGIGAIVDGYIIITPYRCGDPMNPNLSLSDVSREQLDELLFLRWLVAEFYRDVYETGGLAFEHGRAGGCLAGGTGTKHCFHAHLCCYPKSVNLWEDVDGWPMRKVDGLADLRVSVGSSPYLFIESVETDETKPADSAMRETWHSRTFILGEESELESQFLRKLLARRVNQPDLWDWEKYSRVDAARAPQEVVGTTKGALSRRP